jgi:hypothetical protein
LQRRLLWLCGYNQTKIEDVLAARIHELETGPIELFGEAMDESSEDDPDDDDYDIHGQIALDEYGII